MRVAAIIPARGGSVGVPRKNVRPFCGLPLITWTIHDALSSELISNDDIYVTTEDDDVAKIAENSQVGVIERPSYLALDSVTLDPVIVHAFSTLDTFAYDWVVTLQPTCPIRSPGMIDNCIKAAMKGDSLFTVFEAAHFVWTGKRTTVPALQNMQPLNTNFCKRQNRQDLDPNKIIWCESGSVVVTRAPELMRYQRRIVGATAAYEISKWEGTDIDSPEDFAYAEAVFERRMKESITEPAPAGVNCHGVS